MFLSRHADHSDYAYLWEHVAAAHEKCSSRKAAVEAGRWLMAEKIDWLDADLEINGIR